MMAVLHVSSQRLRSIFGAKTSAAGELFYRGFPGSFEQRGAAWPGSW